MSREWRTVSSDGSQRDGHSEPGRRSWRPGRGRRHAESADAPSEPLALNPAVVRMKAGRPADWRAKNAPPSETHVIAGRVDASVTEPVPPVKASPTEVVDTQQETVRDGEEIPPEAARRILETIATTSVDAFKRQEHYDRIGEYPFEQIRQAIATETGELMRDFHARTMTHPVTTSYLRRETTEHKVHLMRGQGQGEHITLIIDEIGGTQRAVEFRIPLDTGPYNHMRYADYRTKPYTIYDTDLTYQSPMAATLGFFNGMRLIATNMGEWRKKHPQAILPEDLDH